VPRVSRRVRAIENEPVGDLDQLPGAPGLKLSGAAVAGSHKLGHRRATSTQVLDAQIDDGLPNRIQDSTDAGVLFLSLNPLTRYDGSGNHAREAATLTQSRSASASAARGRKRQQGHGTAGSPIAEDARSGVSIYRPASSHIPPSWPPPRGSAPISTSSCHSTARGGVLFTLLYSTDQHETKCF
jgi:hypothetical protein